jgi:hypothetical protein
VCVTGVHACRIADLPYWLDEELWEIELAGAVERGGKKLVAARGRLLRRIGAWDDAAMSDFAHGCRERVEGAAAIGAFFATVPLGGRLDLIRLLPARSNGQPALGAYVEAAPYGLMVFALEGTRIVGITGFTGSPELFRAPGFRPSCADGPSVRGRNLLRPHCR